MNLDDTPVQAQAEMDRIRSAALTIEMICSRMQAGVSDSAILIELAGLSLPKTTAWRFIAQARESLKTIKGEAGAAYAAQSALMSVLGDVPPPVTVQVAGEPVVRQASIPQARTIIGAGPVISFGAGVQVDSISFAPASEQEIADTPKPAVHQGERAAALQTQSSAPLPSAHQDPAGGPIQAVNRAWQAKQQASQDSQGLQQLSGRMAQAMIPRVMSSEQEAMLMDGRSVRVTIHHHSPDIVVIEDFLTEQECQELIALGEPKLLKSGVVDNQTGQTTDHAARTSHGTYFSKGQTPLITAIETRIMELVDWPLANSEGMQVMRYQLGQEYKAHYDHFDPTQPSYATVTRSGGNRVGSFLIYLQAPPAGGSTSFPNLGLTVQAKVGRALFWNYLPDAQDTRLLHSGDPVTQGEKWIATKWLRQGEY